MDTDVLIVGAGPTGLMLANQLARRGVRTVILDRHSGPALQTRALGVQARTLEIYSQLGIADRALELGKRGSGATLWANGQKTARVPLGDAGKDISPYPFILVLGQDDNERIMGDRLRDWGGSVRWNTELVGLEQHPGHVAAILKRADGTTETLSAGWVGGCDGAHSNTRELSGIAFPGAPYEHVFFVADVAMTGTMVSDEVNVYLWQAGFHLFFPMRGQDHWRIVGIVPEALRDTHDLQFTDVLPSISGEAGAGFSVSHCTWFSTYRIHHRSAAQFRSGRCFLLGDAAHIHSPVGAQGMNTGLQDAYNLAWKLSLVVQGQADESLLESYEAERMPVARKLLATTDRAFRLIVADNPLAGLLRTRVLARMVALAMRQERMQEFAFRTVSQTGIEYRESPLSQELAGLPHRAPHAGDRFPWLHLRLVDGGPEEDLFQALDDMHFHLLVFGQPLAALTDPHRTLVVHVIPDDASNVAALARVGIPACSFYLLRPDGHVGLCGTQADGEVIASYMSGRMHLRDQET